MKRCVRCIMPETVPGVTFDADGVCSGCRSYKPIAPLGKAKLDEIVAAIRGKGRTYDCVVGVSGGRDSAYVAYTATKLYGLRVLAVNFDNEFVHPQAQANIRATVDALGIDLLMVRSPTDVNHRLVKLSMRASARSGLYAPCYGCTYGYHAAAYKAAEDHGVPLIVWGTASVEELSDVHRQARAAIARRLGTLDKIIIRLNPRRGLMRYYMMRQRREIPVPGNRSTRLKMPELKNPDIRQISLFDYLPWDRKAIKQTIADELGWKKPEGHASSWKADCLLHAFINYYYFLEFGCSQSLFGFCTMICAGQMDRQEALDQELAMAAGATQGVRELLVDSVGLTEREADRILARASAAPAGILSGASPSP